MLSKSNLDTPWGEETTPGSPPRTTLKNPGVESGMTPGSQPQAWIRGTLEEFITVLRRIEGVRAWVRNVPGDFSQFPSPAKQVECIPSRIDTWSTHETDKGMSHLLTKTVSLLSK